MGERISVTSAMQSNNEEWKSLFTHFRKKDKLVTIIVVFVNCTPIHHAIHGYVAQAE